MRNFMAALILSIAPLASFGASVNCDDLALKAASSQALLNGDIKPGDKAEIFYSGINLPGETASGVEYSIDFIDANTGKKVRAPYLLIYNVDLLKYSDHCSIVSVDHN
jgi:hypothetical protein